jgi:hypothetical protein
MAHVRGARPLAIPILALACAACAAPSPPPADPNAGREQPILEYQPECSQLKPRESVVRVRWPVPAKPEDVRIEVSPYKDGFSTGRFVSAPAGDPRAVPSSGVELRAPEVQAQAAKPPSTLAIRLESLRPVKDGAQIEAVLGGLNPGVNYYIRVRGVPGQTIRVQAPICPVDYVETPKESPSDQQE